MQKLFIEKLTTDSKNRTGGAHKLFIAIAAGIFVISLILSIWILLPSDKQLVEVVSDGQILYTFDLSREQDREITVFYGNGSNTIRIESGEIWVYEASCPDHTCMEMGKLYSESLPIVCLPNRLTIRFVD